MKILWVVVTSMVLGLALGVGTTAARFELAGGAGAGFAGGRVPEQAPPGGPQPKVQVDQEDFDFGAMERGATMRHAFVFTNVGGYPLELVQGETTCKCTISTLDEQAVPPGQSVEVVLEWTAKTTSNQFRQSATILTNDPDRPRVNLTVSGIVTQAVEVEPDEIVFSKAEVGETKTAELRLYSFGVPDLQLLDHRFANADSAEHFELASEPLPEDQLPPGAKSGRLVTVTMKPGLPVGPVHQTLELTTNATENNSLAAIAIHGRIISTISIFGQGWDASRGVLALGTVPSQQGLRRELSIFVRGKNPEQVELEVLEIVPEALKISFGEKQSLKKDGSVVKVPLVVEIPPGTRPINRLGWEQSEMGEVLIQTNQAHAEKLRLHVQFAVE